MLIEQIIILLALALPAVVVLLAKRGVQTPSGSVETFTVGDRQYKLLRISAGISMTFVGGAATLNMASLGYQYGWSVAIDPIVVFIALMIVVMLVGRVRAGRGITLTDALAGSSPALRTILALTGLVMYQLLTASQIVALGKLLGPSFQGVPVFVVISIPALLVFAYVYLHGFQAVTRTDVLQLLMMLTLFAAPCLWVFSTRSTPATSAIAAQPAAAPFNLLIYLALPLLFVPVSFDVNIRVKAAASPFHARAGLIVGGLLYVFLLTVSIGIGVFLRRAGQTVASPEHALPYFFEHYLGAFSLIGTIAVLAAIVSSLDSMAFSAIVSASNDFLGPARTRGLLSDRNALTISSIAILGVAMLIGLVFQQILSLVLAALLLYVSIFIPVAVGRRIGTLDRTLVVTCLITGTAIVGCKISGYTPPLEPLAFLGLHLLLVLIVKAVHK